MPLALLGFDFADALHLAASEGAAALFTFDERLIRKGGGCPSFLRMDKVSVRSNS